MKNFISKLLAFITILCLGLATPLDAMRRAPKSTRRITRVSKAPVRGDGIEAEGSDSDDDRSRPSAKKRARVGTGGISGDTEDEVIPTAIPTAIPTVIPPPIVQAPLRTDVPMDSASILPHLPSLPASIPPPVALTTTLTAPLIPPPMVQAPLRTDVPMDSATSMHPQPSLPAPFPPVAPTTPILESAHEAVSALLPPPTLPRPQVLPTAEEILQHITEITTSFFAVSPETQEAFLLVLDHTFGEHMTQAIEILRAFTNARTLNPDVFNTSMNLFHLAALSGNFDIYNKLKRLLGEDVSRLLAMGRDDYGRIPLHYAFLGSNPGHLDIAFAMIQINAALLNTQDESNLTPLEFGALNSPQKGALVAFMTRQITQIIPDFLTTGPTGLFQKVTNQFNPPPPAPRRTTITPPPLLPRKRSVLKPWTWL